jgi:hypothetical protein
MDLQTVLAASARANAVEAVRSRLMIAAAALLGLSEGFTVMPPELVRHLAVELRAIAISLDALSPE